MENLLSSLVSWSLTIMTFLGITYLALQATAIYFSYRNEEQNVHIVADRAAKALSVAILHIWNFINPIIRSVIVIALIYYFAKSSGLLQEEFLDANKFDSKNLLTFFVVGVFGVAALTSQNPAAWLKDIVLVVIGFYFGTKAGS